MPFTHLPCPACNAVLRLSDETPANALLRCPKCDECFLRPAPPEEGDREVMVAEVEAARSSPRSPATMSEADAARLRKIRRPEPRSRMKLWIVLGSLAAVFLLVFVASGAVAIVWLARSILSPPPPQARFVPPRPMAPPPPPKVPPPAMAKAVAATKLWTKGSHLMDQGDLNGAIDAFTEAIELNPRLSPAYFQRAQAFMKRKQWDKAEEDLTRTLELNFIAPGIYQNRAACRTHQGNHKGAIADYTADLRLRPGNAWLYYFRSRAAFAAGDLKGAQADLEKALAINPALVPLHSFRAKILLHEGDGDGALKVAERLVTLQPKSSAALDCRAFIHAWRGEKEKASADYAAAVNLAPMQPEVRLLRGWFYLSDGQADTAAEDADAGLKLAGREHRHSPYLAILAHCAKRQKHPDEARRAIEAQVEKGKEGWPSPVFRYLRDEMSAEELIRTAADDEEQTEARAYVGVVLWLAGAADKARKHLEWVRDNGDPDFIEYDLSLLLLRRLEAAPAQKP